MSWRSLASPQIQPLRLEIKVLYFPISFLSTLQRVLFFVCPIKKRLFQIHFCFKSLRSFFLCQHLCGFKLITEWVFSKNCCKESNPSCLKNRIKHSNWLQQSIFQNNISAGLWCQKNAYVCNWRVSELFYFVAPLLWIDWVGSTWAWRSNSHSFCLRSSTFPFVTAIRSLFYAETAQYTPPLICTLNITMVAKTPPHYVALCTCSKLAFRNQKRRNV